MGAVTPLGNDVPSFWSGLLEGRSGIRTIESFDSSRLTCHVAGEVRDFDVTGVLERKEARRNDRYTQLALVATREAMNQAGLPERLEGTLAEETGVIIGSGMGGTTTLFEQIRVFLERGPDRLSPFFVPMVITNMAAGQAAISFGALGPNYATVSACATSGHAIGESAEIILRGDAEVMLAGGSEAPVSEGLIAAFAAMRALSTRNDDPQGASRPFDQGRDGFIVAEGAGVLVLEERGHAEARNAEILAEVTGYAATADAHHITLPAPGGAGALRATRRALAKAGLDASAVDHVNAHATSTQEGDRAELTSLHALFGDHGAKVSVTATKSAIGHTLGAAGALGSIAAIQAMRERCVPPTLNLDDPDAAIGALQVVAHEPRAQEIDVALVNAFGFGGQNTALVYRRLADLA
ncbi:MAG: beta-ketoacyl-ACP synthase II [Chloroflexi bacterium]|nr:beta-ketoacyl-ACP synthase II [Chloroflexota bacterium]